MTQQTIANEPTSPNGSPQMRKSVEKALLQHAERDLHLQTLR